MLSVPFSSGWALRSYMHVLCGYSEASFQFPFRRDGPCDLFDLRDVCGDAASFQFPFRRDGPCDIESEGWPLPVEILSVPFSSGWALRSPAVAAQPLAPAIIFQFPFRRDGPCDRRNPEAHSLRNSFQFPFRRDGPCDMPYGINGCAAEISSFSSLFVGMGLAIRLWK